MEELQERNTRTTRGKERENIIPCPGSKEREKTVLETQQIARAREGKDVGSKSRESAAPLSGSASGGAANKRSRHESRHSSASSNDEFDHLVLKYIEDEDRCCLTSGASMESGSSIPPVPSAASQSSCLDKLGEESPSSTSDVFGDGARERSRAGKGRGRGRGRGRGKRRKVGGVGV